MTTIQFRDDVLGGFSGAGVKGKFYTDYKRDIVFSVVGWYGNSLLVNSYDLKGKPLPRDFQRDIRDMSACLDDFRTSENITDLISKK